MFSDTDPQSADDSLHHSGTNDSESDSDSPSPRKIGLTKSYDSDESFAGGVGKKEVGYELPIAFAHFVMTSASLHTNATRSSIAI